MVYNIKFKEQAVSLRKQGYLFAEIADRLNISKSTAYLWTSEVNLTPTQKEKIETRLHDKQIKHIDKLAVINKERKLERDKLIEQKGSNIVNNIQLNKHMEALLCSILFWCEGGKDISSGIQFINSDHKMIATFLLLFRRSFNPDESKFRAIIHLHEYHDPEKQLKYWANVTKIPQEQFYRPYKKTHTGKNNRLGYPGCISIRYLDRSFGKLMQTIYTEFVRSIGV